MTISFPFNVQKRARPMPYLTFGPNLEVSVSHRRCVGLTNGRAKFLNHPEDVKQVREDPTRKRQRLLFYFNIEECYLP